MPRENDLPTTNPPVAKATRRWPIVVSLLTLAAPMLLGQAGQVLLQLTDTLLIGHVGAVELAAASLAGNFVMFALYFAYGAVGAVSPTIAQLHGAGDRDGVSRTAEAGAWLALIIGGVIAVSLSGVVPLLEHLGQPPAVARAAWGYLLLIAWSMPGAILAVVLGQVAEAVDRPWPVFGFMVLAVVLNALLAWCLVFGHAGFPALGLPGAGLATFAARWVHAAALAGWMLSDPRVAGRRSGNRGPLPRDLSVIPAIGRLFRQGLPLAAQDVLEGGAFAFGALMLGWVGTTALAANQVTVGIASLAWMVPVSLSMATGVRVAQAAGAGDMDAARRTGIAAMLLGTSLMAVCAVFYVASGRWLAGLFTDDPEVAALAGTLVSIAGIYQVSDVIQSVSLGALRGLLDNRVPMLANAVCYWGLSLPTVWFLTFRCGWGAAGVWAGYLPWMVATGLFFLVRFLRLTAPRTPAPAGSTPWPRT
jgi:MATE family multidrug resistance protein